jgi:hypothetical protein
VRRAKESVDLAPTDDVYLIPFPRQKSLSAQLVEVFQQTMIRVAGSGLMWTEGLPAPLRQIADWTRELPSGTPLLIPPALIEIH